MCKTVLPDLKLAETLPAVFTAGKRSALGPLVDNSAYNLQS
jgi:hypothetical protein